MGERFGAFTLLEKLGEGGVATVYRVRDDNGNIMVLKRLRNTSAAQKLALAREAELASRLRHPNIVRVFGLVEHEGEAALLMEELEGLSLHQLARRSWLSGRSLPLEPLVHAMADAALALAEAHSQEVPIVHRDVSPDNLILTTTGATKLLDFGVAKADDAADLTKAGEIKGKLSFMAPEQMRGESIDGRADLWALGITFYFLFTGRKPFKRDTTPETMRAVLSESLPRPTLFNSRLPEELERLLMRILVRDPQARIASGHELAAELRALLLAVPDDFVAASRLLAVLEGDESGTPPVHASLPSVDWTRGERLPKTVYDQTQLIDVDFTAELPTQLWREFTDEDVFGSVLSETEVAAPEAVTALDAAPITQSMDAMKAEPSVTVVRPPPKSRRQMRLFAAGFLVVFIPVSIVLVCLLWWLTGR